jgi:hypothetical protein
MSLSQAVLLGLKKTTQKTQVSDSQTVQGIYIDYIELYIEIKSGDGPGMFDFYMSLAFLLSQNWG